MIIKMDHVGMVVKDVKTAAKTYEDMFGFKVIEERENPSGEFKSVMLENGETRPLCLFVT